MCKRVAGIGAVGLALLTLFPLLRPRSPISASRGRVEPAARAAPLRVEEVASPSSPEAARPVSSEEPAPAPRREGLFAPSDDDAWLRTLWVLAQDPRPEALGWFAEFLRAGVEPRFKMRAACALADRETADALTLLVSELRCEDPVRRSSAAAAVVLRSECDPAALPIAAMILRDPEYAEVVASLPAHLRTTTRGVSLTPCPE